MFFLVSTVSAEYGLFTASGGVESFETDDFGVSAVLDRVGVNWAVLEGEVVDFGPVDEPVEFGFEYRGENESDWKYVKAAELQETGFFEAKIEDLKKNSMYEFRGVSEQGHNSEVSAFSTLTDFTISGEVVSFETDDFSVSADLGSVGVDWMVLESEVIDFGPVNEPIEFKFQYRENGTDNWNTTPATKLIDDGTYQKRIENLEEDTFYEIQAVSEEGVESPVVTEKTASLKTRRGNTVPFAYGDKFLEWEYESSADGFRIYSNQTSSDFEMIHEVEDSRNKNETGFAGVSADSGTFACYYVTVFENEDGELVESEPSNEESEVCRQW